jgi:hypothetical protein
LDTYFVIYSTAAARLSTPLISLLFSISIVWIKLRVFIYESLLTFVCSTLINWSSYYLSVIFDWSLISCGNFYLQVVHIVPSFLRKHLSREHVLCLLIALSIFINLILITWIICWYSSSCNLILPLNNFIRWFLSDSDSFSICNSHSFDRFSAFWLCSYTLSISSIIP